MVRSCSPLRRDSISHTATRETGSSPVVGSSRKKIFGSCTSPLALFAPKAIELGKDTHVFLRAQIEVRGHCLGDDPDRFAHVVGGADNIKPQDAGRAGGG